MVSCSNKFRPFGEVPRIQLSARVIRYSRCLTETGSNTASCFDICGDSTSVVRSPIPLTAVQDTLVVDVPVVILRMRAIQKV